MRINPISNSNYKVNTINQNRVALCGKQEADIFEINSNEPEKQPSFLKRVFDKCGLKTGAERDKAVKLPEILDLEALRTRHLSKRVATICMKYGNADISQLKPKVLDRAKSNLEEKGIDVKDDNMKLVIMSDSDDNWVVKYKILSYYDDTTDTSIVFDEIGDPSYILSYKYDSLGSIKGYQINSYFN